MTGEAESCSTLGKGIPTQHNQAGFLSGSRRCLRKQQRRQTRRRREARETSTSTTITIAGTALLSGPVGKAVDTQFVHEENKTTPRLLQTSLGQCLGCEGVDGALGTHANPHISGTTNRPVPRVWSCGQPRSTQPLWATQSQHTLLVHPTMWQGNPLCLWPKQGDWEHHGMWGTLWAVRQCILSPRVSGCSPVPHSSVSSSALTALPSAFPTCRQPSEWFPDLPQEAFHGLLLTPGQEQGYILTLHQAVCGQDQGHV